MCLSLLGITTAKESSHPDVLIVYSSGQPFKSISEMAPSEVDAVSGATPARINCKRVAEALEARLQKEKRVVRVADASEIKEASEILGAKVIVFGSPSRFWNMSWEMKRLMDELIGRIYVVNKKAFENKQVAFFAMAEIEESAKDTLVALTRPIRDCGGRSGLNMIILTTHSEKDTMKRVEDFAKKIENFL
jgi:flavodoxin